MEIKEYAQHMPTVTEQDQTISVFVNFKTRGFFLSLQVILSPLFCTRALWYLFVSFPMNQTSKTTLAYNIDNIVFPEYHITFCAYATSIPSSSSPTHTVLRDSNLSNPCR